MKVVTRRTALQLLGAGIGTLSGACSGSSGKGGGYEADGSAAVPGDGDGGTSDAGGGAEDAGHASQHDAGGQPHGDGDGTGDGDAGADAGHDAGQPSAEELLSTVDTIVVLMMENRSFDHFFGALKLDPAYKNRDKI